MPFNKLIVQQEYNMNFSFKKKSDVKSSEGQLRSPKVGQGSLDKVSKKSKISSFIGQKKFHPTAGAKYGIIIGDEGAILIYIVGKEVKSRNFIAHASSDNLKEFASILTKDPNAPIFLIIDSIDQNFIQQTLPPISALGVKKLIKRRLDREVGADILKGYVLLERDADGRKDWNFLMVSLENTQHLNLWFEFVESLDNRISGIYLLSVEAENIVKSLDVAMALKTPSKQQDNKSRWKFFITHNKIGGFRQVILKNGRIIFTRLTQPIGESRADVISGNIEQEILSTIEYMKRMSFNNQDGLDIYVVASSEINSSLDLSRAMTKNIYKFTPFEVAELLGITGAAQHNDQFGDVILTAFISSSRQHRLVLSLPKMRKINNLYNMIRYQRVAAALILFLIVSYSSISGSDLFSKYSEIESLTQKKNSQQKQLEDLQAEIKNSGIDVKKINDTVVLYSQIKSELQTPIPLLSRLRPAIMDSVSIREVTWENAVNGGAATPQPAPNTQAASENISLVLRFPEAANTKETFEASAKKLLKEMKERLPEYNISYKKLPAFLSDEKKATQITFDDKNNAAVVDKANLEATVFMVKDPNYKANLPNVTTNRPLIPTSQLNGGGQQ